MAGLGITDVGSFGYSRSGAQEFKEDLKAQGITTTAQKLGEIGGIRDAFQAGWQGKAEENFEKNLQTAITIVQQNLEEIKKALDVQFATIDTAIVTNDNEMIPEDMA